MYFYEIKNTRTHRHFEVTAPSFRAACKMVKQKPSECKLIWRASPENAGDPKDY